PTPVNETVRNNALEITRTIVEGLDVIGILCVEFFQERDGALMVNELAPRPHNSGHLTIDACHSCQFEQQVRAVCGLPLGSSDMLRPAAMANLLGDLWGKGEPNWKKALAVPTVKLHLYGKSQARPGRKMGHLTALGNTPEEARQRVIQARAALTNGRGLRPDLSSGNGASACPCCTPYGGKAPRGRFAVAYSPEDGPFVARRRG
ncbi:MAG: ATP-grasp domain-containing protein, partial [Pseudomonadota bacterium]